jgi:hypothetical protein
MEQAVEFSFNPSRVDVNFSTQLSKVSACQSDFRLIHTATLLFQAFLYIELQLNLSTSTVLPYHHWQPHLANSSFQIFVFANFRWCVLQQSFSIFLYLATI